MKTYHFAELTYRDINFDVAHKIVSTKGFNSAIKFFNKAIEESVRYRAKECNELRVNVQVKACQKWFKEDLIKEYN